MAENLKIFDAQTLLRIRSTLLEDDFGGTLSGTPAEIAELVGGRLIDSGIPFESHHQMELPPVGSTEFDGTDLINTEVVFDALPGLTAFQASRDELWATLCLGSYRSYVQRRWRPKSQQSIDLRRNYQLHYLSSTVRNRWRDNGVSRLWWLRHYAQSINPADPQEVLSVLFFRDKNLGESMLTKPSISTVPSVAKSIFHFAYRGFIDPGTSTYSREAFRSFVREIDLNTGRTLLPLLEEEDVVQLVGNAFKKFFGS